MSALEELSDKLNEVYDLELIEGLTKIFNNVVVAYKELDDKVRSSGKVLGCREKCDELGEVEKEKEQAEYENYFVR